MEDLKQKMEKSLDNLKKNFAGVRTGRANPGLVEHIQVDLYGQKMPLKSIASVNVPESRTLCITPYDRSSVQSIEKAISNSDLGLTPRSEGHVIYLRVPELTQDRRKELEKHVKGLAEEGRIALRNIRRDVLDTAKKEGMSTDELKGYQDKVQKVTDEFTKKIDELVAHKEKELHEI